MIGRSGRRYAVLGLLLIVVGLLALWVNASSRYGHLDQAIQVMAQVKLRYLEPVSLLGLFRAYLGTGTINGMLASLRDPYTYFLSPPKYRELRTQMNPTFGGIGITLSYVKKSIIVMRIFRGSPGEAAGLRHGDRIIQVNGRPVEGMSPDEAVATIRGPAGTTVRLTIARGTGAAAKIRELRIRRATIKVPSVESEFVDDPEVGRIAFITISQFAERTAAELSAMLRSTDRERVRGVVVDLRYNGGGLMEAAIEVASEFLDGGVVMYMIKRDGYRRPFFAKRSRPRYCPLVVLVNQWSASASEIVAGALKDRGAATLVGARTFGKGTVMEIVPLSGGAALSVTVAKYLTAGGHSIDKVGIEPDVVVDIPGAMERALKSGKLDELQRLERWQRDRAVEILRAEIAHQATAAS